MGEALFAGAAITIAALLVGQAVIALAGGREPSPVAPAVGLSALLVICGVAVKLPGHATTAAIATGLAVIVAAAVLVRGPATVRAVRLAPSLVALGAAAIAAIPFLAVGRVGILGQGLVNDDMASHLLFAEWVGDRVGTTPELIAGGYPLGPHAIVAAASELTGGGLVASFAGLTGAIAVLISLTAWGALRGVWPPLRVAAALLVAFSYLSAAYLAQGAFKEPMLALALIGFTLCLPGLRSAWDAGLTGSSGLAGEHRAQARAAIPAGVIAAGTIYNYSFPGLGWLALAALGWALLVAWRERDQHGGLELRRRARGARTAIVVGVGIAAIAALPEVVRLIRFSGFEAFAPGGEGEGGRVGFGNLRQALSPLEAFGIWPSSEFRVSAASSSTPEIAFYLGGALALAAAGWGLWRAALRREAALPAALFAAAIGYIAALGVGTPYTGAKALAVASPLVMLIALRGLLGAGPLTGEEQREVTGNAAPTRSVPGASRADSDPRWLGTPLVRSGLAIGTAAFMIAAGFSSLLPIRQAAVGSADQAEQLLPIRRAVQGERVLFLGRDNFIAWKLLGADLDSPILNHYNVREVTASYKATAERAKFDFDSVPANPEPLGECERQAESCALDSYRYLITTSAAQRSSPPPGTLPVVRTRDYVLWQRTRSVAARRTLLEPAGPGALVDCSRPEGRALSTLAGRATVFRSIPIVGDVWKPSPEITPGTPAGEELLLMPGRWAISIQYASTQPIRVRGGGLDVTLPENLLFRGPAPFFPVGELELDRRTLVRVKATIERPNLIGRVLGAETRAFLGPIAATPIPATETLALAETCGRYLDSYTPDPGTPAGALAPIRSPDRQPVIQD